MAKALRINAHIRAPEVMLIGSDGTKLGLVSLEEAREHAADADMDLVEVAPDAKPPVCKIMDYGKYKYRLSKKAHDAKKKQKSVRLKEVKTTPATEEHDYRFKLNHAKRFLEHGDKVKVTVFFKGRQITHSELGLKILERFAADLEDMAVVESEPKQEGRNMGMVFAPRAEVVAPREQEDNEENED
ncbi:MAG: translation initiation factor IF-3 [Candidatus Nitrospinota bacterium M3_3B_026]